MLEVGKKFEQGKIPLPKIIQSETQRKNINAKDGPAFPHAFPSHLTGTKKNIISLLRTSTIQIRRQLSITVDRYQT